MERMTTMEQRIATCEAGVSNLERWQKAQNGSIHRVEAKVDHITEMLTSHYKWISGIALLWVFQLIMTLLCIKK